VSASTTTADVSVKNALDLAPAGYSSKRIMYWCMRREVWENRSIYIAPFVTAALMVLALLIIAIEATIHVQPPSGDVGGIGGNAPLWAPYILVATPILATGLIVAIAYCLGALHSERRDRSILFWKSLPVSDLITVLSKASVPLVLIPLTSFLAAVVLQLLFFTMVLVFVPLIGAKAHLVWAGVPIGYRTIGMLWSGVPISYLTLGMIYALLATALWHAPIYAWFLLVGGWARRMAFVWALAPPAALIVVERVAFGTTHLAMMFLNRLYGVIPIAFANLTNDSVPDLTPIQFFGDPQLWIGLAFAAIFLGAAVLMRRHRQPI